MRPKARYIAFCITLLLAASCKKEACSDIDVNARALFEWPEHFPSMSVPDDNGYTKERWTLGKKLFYETSLSQDGQVSCASCHDPEKFFTDGLATSFGNQQLMGIRNAPSLANVVFEPYLLREGGVPSLEMQVLVPFQEHNEFGLNILEAVDRLKSDPEYLGLAEEAYDRTMDAFVITRAIANFQRSLVSANSAYDQYLIGSYCLSDKEAEGMALFESERLACSQCHNGILFTDHSFKNNGLYIEYDDPGRFRLTNEPSDLATFKVPSLRNVAETAPYMHDGSFTSLAQIIDHYASGGFDHPNKSEIVDGFTLNQPEKEALISFLKTLTDHSFSSDPKFK